MQFLGRSVRLPLVFLLASLFQSLPSTGLAQHGASAWVPRLMPRTLHTLLQPHTPRTGGGVPGGLRVAKMHPFRQDAAVRSVSGEAATRDPWKQSGPAALHAPSNGVLRPPQRLFPRCVSGSLDSHQSHAVSDGKLTPFSRLAQRGVGTCELQSPVCAVLRNQIPGRPGPCYCQNPLQCPPANSGYAPCSCPGPIPGGNGRLQGVAVGHLSCFSNIVRL